MIDRYAVCGGRRTDILVAVTVRTRNGRKAFSDSQIESFERDGYLIVDDPCSPDLVDAVATEFDERFRDKFHPGPKHMRDGVLYATHKNVRGGYHWQRIMDAWRISDSARAMALEPNVLSLLEGLYDRKPRAFQTLNFPVGTQQPAHSDSMFFSADPPRFMCGVWVALEDMDMENGPLVYYPGSHKLPTPSLDLVEREIGEHIDSSSFKGVDELRRERNRQYSIYCRHLIETKGLERAYGTIRKGQAVIWSSNLLHGGSPQADPSRTRHSQVSHYLFEDVRLHRPSWSENGLIYWDYPVWVRERPPTFSASALGDAVEAVIARGSSVLVATRNEALVSLPGMRTAAFPGNDRKDDLSGPLPSEAVSRLESLQADGAEYMVVPPDGLQMLQMQMPEVQQVLEKRHRPIFVDGAICAIYDLR